MSHETFDELAHAALEGVATAEELQALEASLTEDPALRARWRELRTAFQALAEITPVAPPADLKRGVLDVIRRERAASSRRAPAAGWNRVFAFRLGAAFASGLAVGVLAWTLATGGWQRSGSQATSGTMMPPEATPAGQADLEAGGATAHVERWSSRNIVELRVDARTSGTTQLALVFDPALQAESLQRIRSDSTSATLSPGRVSLEFSGGLQCVIRLSGASADVDSIHVRLRSGDGIAEEVLAGRSASP